jgi:hypothetical protein
MSGIPTTGSLEIVIQMPSETGANTNETPSPSSPQTIENVTGNPTEGDKNGQVKLSMALQTAKNIGMQGLNAAVSNIGLATGNYYAQQRAQKTIGGIQSIVGLAMSFTNPYTAIAAVAGMAISAGAEVYQQNREREIANYESAQVAKRLGYTRDRR